LLRAEPGAGFIARRSGAPLVPIAITGSQNVLNRRAIIPRRAEVAMTFGAPFQLPDRNRDGSRMDHQQSADYLMTKIAELLPLENQGEYASSPMSRSAPA
jgi:1-acyl-sn-glycerol-3-phosphate acyltransferase